MSKNNKYIYWLEGKNGGLGGFTTRTEAKRKLEALNSAQNWRIVRYLAQPCPICHKPEKDSIIDELGRCLACMEIDVDLPNYPPDQYNMVRDGD